MDRISELKRMKFDQGLSNAEIGRRMGISRERVRQLIGNTGKTFRRNWTRNKINSGEIDLSKFTRDEVENLNLPGLQREWLKVFAKKRHKVERGNAWIVRGHQFEELAHNMLSDYGIPNKLMGFSSPYDILVGSSVRIDVKSCFVSASKYPSQIGMRSPSYAIANIKCGEDCDFFFIFVPDASEPTGYTYFVIPSYEMYGLSYSSKIKIVWPQLGKKASKWAKYHKKMDLILAAYT